MVTPPALELEAVSHTYRTGRRSRRAIADVSLAVPQGTIVALLGDNGAGKSTLMSVAAGLVVPDKGAVRIMGELRSAAPRKGRGQVGLVAQDDCVYPVLTVRENLSFVGRLAGLLGRSLTERLNRIAGEFGLLGVMNAKASALSGGQRRRLNLAMSLIHDPSLVLLDEPSVGLDQASRLRLLEVVADLAGRGVGVLYSTHQFDEVEALSADVVIVDHGRIILTGPVAELIESYAPPLIEIVLDGAQHDLPPRFARSIESATTTPEGWQAIAIRLEGPQETVSSVIDLLDPGVRRAVLSAAVKPPDLETAYRRIIRFYGVGEPDLGGMETS